MFPTIDWFYFQGRFVGEMKITVRRKNKMVSVIPVETAGELVFP